MKPVVVLDIDGVLADFTLGFLRLAAEVTGMEPEALRIKGSVEQNTWQFRDDYDNPGFSKRNEDDVWDVIRESETFWVDMPSLTTEADDEALRVLAEQFDIVYVTDRNVGVDPVGQTVMWLVDQELPNPYHVLSRRVTRQKKWEIVKDLCPIAVLEDSPKNLPQLVKLNVEPWMLADINIFRMVRRYNPCCPGIPIYTVAEFCRAVEALPRA